MEETDDRRVLRLEDMSDDQIQEMIDAKIPEEFHYMLSDIPEDGSAAN